MAAANFSPEQRKKLTEQLEVPFDPAEIKWKVMRTAQNGRRGVILPYADPRAYTDRLNQLFTASGWTRTYTISTVPSLTRVDAGKVIVTSKVLVATAVTIHRFGSHTGTGEEWADRENAMTAADAQAFKRACSCFGLGRYLYRFDEIWVTLNRRGQPTTLPILPQWALPPGVSLSPENPPQGRDKRGPIDHRLAARIEAFRETLGEHIYAEILRRAGHSRAAKTIPNADRQKNVVEWMEAAARGFDRARALGEMVGQAQFTATVNRLEIASADQIASLDMLKRLVGALESIAEQHVA